MNLADEEFLENEIKKQVAQAFTKLDFQKLLNNEIRTQATYYLERYLQEPEITKLIMALIENEVAKARPPEPLSKIEAWQVSAVVQNDYLTKQIIQKQVDERISDWLSVQKILNKPSERIIPY